MADRVNVKRVGIGLVFLGVVGVAAAGLLWLVARPAPIPHTQVNPLGANFFLAREVEHWKQEKTLALAREAGIGWIKQQF
ncbi:MAG: hypothetical protein PVH17_04620, partial [Anaerolineae bacterium]